jgi:O-antigen ligase
MSDKIIELGLVFLIFFTPLAFGSVYIWAYSIMELAVFSMLIVLIMKRGLIQGKKISFPLVVPIVVFLSFVLFQLTPLPPSATKLISPQTHEIYSRTLDGYPEKMIEQRGKRQTVEGTPPIVQRLEVRGITLEGKKPEGIFENWRTLSLDPHATRTELLKILSYLGIFLLIINYVESKRRLIRMSTIIVFSGILVALLGIVQKLGEAPKIYWFWEPLFKKDATFFGPFVNPNHFAGYIEMVIPLSMGLFISKWRYLGGSRFRGIRGFLIKVGTEEGCKLVLFGFLIALMVGALLLSSSRGGVVSFLVSMACFLLLLTKKNKDRRTLLVAVVLLCSVLSLVIWIGIRPLLEEFSSVQNLSRDYDIQYRFQNWKDSTKLIRDFPLVGVGLQAFSSIFPKYKTIRLQYYYLYAENDYLQLLCEMGILGFGVFAWFAASFLLQVKSGHTRYKGDRTSRVHYISFHGCLTGIVAIMIHNFWDFNMHIPSNALLLSIIMGLAIAGGHIRQNEYSQYSQEVVL